MKLKKRLTLLILLPLLVSCEFGMWGWLFSSDVDERFAESRTLTQPSDQSLTLPYSFIVISDPHVQDENYTAEFNTIAAELIASDSFIIVCGDLTHYGYEEEYQSFITLETVTGIPVYSTLGNHDLYHDGWQYFKKYIGASVYTFTVGPVKFIALDSANGTFGGPQAEWLKTELQQRTEEYCVVFTHMQGFMPAPYRVQQFTDIEEFFWLMDLLESNDTNYLFMGHSHRNWERTINGTNYCIAGRSRKAYIRVTVTASGISHEYVSL